MKPQTIRTILEQYNYFIMYCDSIAVSYSRYDEYELNDELNILKFYTGNFLNPVCALNIIVQHIKNLSCYNVSVKADKIRIKLVDDKEIELLGYYK